MVLIDRVDPSFREPFEDFDPDPDVSLAEFFDPAFMEEYTRFQTFEAFCAESPWRIDDRSDVEHLPRDALNRYVDTTTEFDDWIMMRNRAASREIRQQLLL